MRALIRARPVVLVLAAVGVFALSGGASWADGSSDHERARRALEAGEVMPLRAVLAHLEQDYPGEVIEVELEREDGAWVYEIKLIRTGGDVLELELDARDGALRRIRGRDVRAARAREGGR